MKNKKVLVTGGAGFIGSHLVEKLVNQEVQVTVLDNLSTGCISNLEKVKGDIKFVKGDIKILKDCQRVAENKDVIFHLAAEISVAESLENPSKCYETNVIGTLNMLEAARHNKVKRFVFSSSAAVYGPQHEPCHEDSMCKPESPYGHSKLMGELLCKNYWRNYGIETICLRYFNIFGDRQNSNGSYAAVVAAFNHCMKHNKPITIFGDGLQTRDFISVQHVIEANIRLASSCEDNAGKVFNIASGKSITLLDLIENLKKKFPDYNLETIFKPARAGDIKYSVADCQKFSQVIDLAS